MCFMAGNNSIFGCKLLTRQTGRGQRCPAVPQLGLIYRTEVQAGDNEQQQRLSNRFLRQLAKYSSATRQPCDLAGMSDRNMSRRRATGCDFRVRRVVGLVEPFSPGKESGSVISPATVIWVQASADRLAPGSRARIIDVGSGGSGHVSGYTTAHQALKNWPTGWATREALQHCYRFPARIRR